MWSVQVEWKCNDKKYANHFGQPTILITEFDNKYSLLAWRYNMQLRNKCTKSRVRKKNNKRLVKTKSKHFIFFLHHRVFAAKFLHHYQQCHPPLSCLFSHHLNPLKAQYFRGPGVFELSHNTFRRWEALQQHKQRRQTSQVCSVLRHPGRSNLSELLSSSVRVPLMSTTDWREAKVTEYSAKQVFHRRCGFLPRLYRFVAVMKEVLLTACRVFSTPRRIPVNTEWLKVTREKSVLPACNRPLQLIHAHHRQRQSPEFPGESKRPTKSLCWWSRRQISTLAICTTCQWVNEAQRKVN